MSDETPDRKPQIDKDGANDEKERTVPVRRRRRGRQRRDRLDAYLTHARNCHAKGLTVAQRKEEARKIAASRPNMQEGSRDTYEGELNNVADPALGPFIERLYEIASDLHDAEVELCDIANQPAEKRPRLQIIFMNRLCERALNAPGGVSAAIAEFMQELADAKRRLEAARKGQFELPV